MVFEEGYNRLNWGIYDPGYKPIPPTKEHKSTEYVPKKQETDIIDTDNLTKAINSSLPSEFKNQKAVSENPSISNVYDRKNQLSSLIQNAQQNKRALNDRNEHVKHAKEASRRTYGW